MSTSKLEIDDNIIKSQLLFNDEQEELHTLFPSKASYSSAIISPKPGICVKTKNTQTGEKVFINVCVAESVPTPEDITNDELIAIFESDNPSDFKIPMSLGPPHQEQDKGGCCCVAYDVIINPTFYDKMDLNPLFHNFFMIVTIEGIDDKYGVSIDKNCWTVLKNKKYHGNMSQQTVRTSLPLVQELSGIKEWKADDFPATAPQRDENLVTQQPPLITEVSSRKVGGDAAPAKRSPHVVVRKVPRKCSLLGGAVLEAEVELPQVVSSTGVRVGVGEDRFVVESDEYFLDHVLPFAVDGTRARAFFIRPTRVLVLRMEMADEGEMSSAAASPS